MPHHTLLLPAHSAADRRELDLATTALARQLGFAPEFEYYKDDQGRTWAVAGWDLTPAQVRIVAMLRRRGRGAHSPPALRAARVHQSRAADLRAARKLAEKVPPPVDAGGGSSGTIDERNKDK